MFEITVGLERCPICHRSHSDETFKHLVSSDETVREIVLEYAENALGFRILAVRPMPPEQPIIG